MCTKGHPAEIRPHAELRTSGYDSVSATTRDLREAEALEKTRIRSEKQVMQSTSVRPIDMHQNLPMGNADEPATNPRRAGRHTRKLQSPYFTAKDPNAPPKKKGNAKALPPVTN
jgi:hypothetical protein